MVSRSVTKAPAPNRMNENLGMMRLRSVWMRTIRAFVTDPDILGLSSGSRRCPPGSCWRSLKTASGRGLFRPAIAQGSGDTGQGLSVLHETPTPVEYTHLSVSSTQTSCSTRPAPPQQPSAPLRRRAQATPAPGAAHPTGVSEVMTPETLRSHETTHPAARTG